MKTSILFDNGLFLSAKSFGASATKTGELTIVKNFYGEQEILSAPEHAGKFVLFAFTQFGMRGANDEDGTPLASGMIVNKYSDFYSNFRAKMSLAKLLMDANVMGICELDTRHLIKTLPPKVRLVASNITHNRSELEQKKTSCI
ncbi:MAG: hypothetical protein CSA19_00845 [Deltaproteobacteria bacterium]|nr:MAG: hypothetical protein CSA19_00845 [Deltaproteobacteria bacterium]